MVVSCLFISTYLCCSFSVFKYILSSIPLLCSLFISVCLSACYTFGALWNHQCVLQMCYQNKLMCYQNREVEILNDLNDLDLNDRKRPLSSWLFSEVSGLFLWLSLLIIRGRLYVLYPMQLVTPSVVAIAVRMLMAICRIVFQESFFIFFSVECWVLNVEFLGTDRLG